MLDGYKPLTIKNKTIKLIKKNSFKLLSIILIISLVFIAISFQSVTSMAAIPDKPGFTISNISFDPNEPKAGEEIEVSGTIAPTDFEIPVPPKEIVLVLDVSGSMKDEVTVECTNERVKHKVESGYWTYTGTWPFRSKVWVDTSYYTDDYCEEHKEVGEHTYTSTKIAELKKAANNFVERMKDVPNLKIGIVAYSSKAWINPNGKNGNESTKSIDSNGSHDVPKYQSVGSDLLNITDSRLPNMINNLEALGGTNTGEGIRKAAYMLGNENTASKTIVLMSDGLPTFYSVKGSNNRDYYTTIDNNNPYYAGSGSGDNNNGDCLNYAKTIGGLIKEKGYNVFSIGYGLDDSGNTKLSQIHKSMGGSLPSGSEEDDEQTYFETDNGAIDTVFQNIATQIINNYDIKDGIFTSKMIDGFELASGGKTVSIPNIQYKKDEINSSSSKIRYHAEPYTFTLKIRALRAGDYSDIFKDSYISFPWNNGTISCVMPNSSIKVIDNKLPNIEASLKQQTQTVNLGQEVTVSYEINAESFEYKDDENQLLPKDVVILFDTSSGMKEKIGQFINGGFNDLLNNDQLRSKHTKYSIITFNSEAIICDPSKYQNFKPNDKYDTANLKTDTTAINDYVVKNLTASQSPDRKIGLALKKANQVLSEDKENSNKYILLISSGPVTYEEKDVLTLREKGYIILSLSIGTENSSEDPETFLYDVHKQLAGQKSASSDEDGGNYFISTGKENNNDISNSIIKNITKKIIDLGERKSYSFNDVYLNFDVGENFEYIEGLEWVENNKYRLKIPNIIYNYDQNSNKYVAEEVNDASFKIKPVKTGADLLFGDFNTITYTGINETIDKNILTPRITVAGGDIKHGVYKGILKGTKIPSIDENPGTVSNESALTMGAYFNLYNANSNIKLTIDEDLTLITDISIFKVNNYGDLTQLGLMTRDTTSSNDFSFTFKNSSDIGEIILVLYTVKLPTSTGNYTNVINVDGVNKEATIRSNGDLPDLF